MASSAIPLQDLLLPRESSKRERPKAFLYEPYSPKMYRRIYCYTHHVYDLWALIEADQHIIKFNERVPAIPVANADKVEHFVPSLFSQGRDGSFVAHVIEGTDEDDGSSLDMTKQSTGGASKRQAIELWGTQNNCQIEYWTATRLRNNPVHLANIKQLLCYISNPDYVPSAAIQEAIVRVLRQSRAATVDHVIRMLSQMDDAEIMREIATLILDGNCSSDITKYPFHYSTELSVFHDLS